MHASICSAQFFYILKDKCYLAKQTQKHWLRASTFLFKGLKWCGGHFGFGPYHTLANTVDTQAAGLNGNVEDSLHPDPF